MMNDEPYTLF